MRSFQFAPLAYLGAACILITLVCPQAVRAQNEPEYRLSLREAAQSRLRLAEQEVQQAQQRFRTGVAGNAHVITALLSLSDARDMLTGALVAYQAARINLARSEGIITTLP